MWFIYVYDCRFLPLHFFVVVMYKIGGQHKAILLLRHVTLHNRMQVSAFISRGINVAVIYEHFVDMSELWNICSSSEYVAFPTQNPRLIVHNVLFIITTLVKYPKNLYLQQIMNRSTNTCVYCINYLSI